MPERAQTGGSMFSKRVPLAKAVSDASAVPATLDSVCSAVARAVSLEEGPPGVRTVLRQLARREPVSVRELSRASGLPVPVVAAICNELRGHGLVGTQRPAQLTEEGRALTRAVGAPSLAARCDECRGRGLRLPPELPAILTALDELERAAPAAHMELDQAHCTPETKALRALLLDEAGVLAGSRLLLVGDDDLTSLTIATMAAAGVVAGPDEMTVVDVDEDLTRFVAERAGDLGVRTDVLVHDLREPLPPPLRARFDVAFTDPPYTRAGAALFVSRALEGLAPGAGRDLFFAFGPKSPEVSLSVQRLLTGMGLVTQRMLPRFNDYLGAGIIGGTSDLYHLRTSTSTAPDVAGRFDGELYTGERARAPRRYVCATCGHEYLVGAGRDLPTVAALKAQGCSACSGTSFRPGRLAGQPPDA
jgi:predicted methyltransferase